MRAHYARHQGPKTVLHALGTDFKLIPGARSEAWADGTGLRNGGALLVRPDQHILMRLEPRTSAEEILASLKDFLGK